MTKPTGRPRGRPVVRELTVTMLAKLAATRLNLPQLQELRRLLAAEAGDRVSGRTPDPHVPRPRARRHTEAPS